MLNFKLKSKILIITSIFLLNILFLYQFILALSCSDFNKNNLTESQSQIVIKSCENEIKADNAKIRSLKRAETSIEADIQINNIEIKKFNSKINSSKARVINLGSEILGIKVNIEELEIKKENSKDYIVKYLNKKNEYEYISPLEAFLSGDSISNVFLDYNNFDILKTNLTKNLEQYNQSRVQLGKSKKNLEDKKQIELSLKYQEEISRKELLNLQRNKQSLLKKTTNQARRAELDKKSKEKVISELKSRQYKTSSGQSVTFGQALNEIKLYKDDLSRLGVSPEFLLAILFQESGSRGKIGGNIGKCTYNQKNPCRRAPIGSTVMRSNQKSVFEKLMSDLKINAKEQEISCPVCSAGFYGGAMGPAQFIPTTWEFVKNKTSQIIGIDSQYLSPFKIRDSFLASAVLLGTNIKNKSCLNYANNSVNQKYFTREDLLIRCAASRYYAGNNWKKFRHLYGEQVRRRASSFRQDIKTIGF